MLKKTLTYKDLDGNPVTEDFYFNLSKAEITEMGFSEKGGFAEHLEDIVENGDNGVILAEFKKILLKAYGQRSEDGRRFIKSDQVSEEFTQKEAYSDIFMELVTNPEATNEFVKAIIPADLLKDLKTDEKPRDVVNIELPTVTEKELSYEELVKALEKHKKTIEEGNSD